MTGTTDENGSRGLYAFEDAVRHAGCCGEVIEEAPNGDVDEIANAENPVHGLYFEGVDRSIPVPLKQPGREITLTEGTVKADGKTDVVGEASEPFCATCRSRC